MDMKNESPEYSGRIFAHLNHNYKVFFDSLKNNLDEYLQHLSVNHNLINYHIVWVGYHKDDETPSIPAHYHNESNISFVYYLKTDTSSDKLCITV